MDDYDMPDYIFSTHQIQESLKMLSEIVKKQGEEIELLKQKVERNSRELIDQGMSAALNNYYGR